MTMESSDFDTFLWVLRRNPPQSEADVVFYDDDSGGGTNSYISGTLPETREYFVYANSYGPAEYGDYTVDVLFPNRSGAAGLSLNARASAAKEKPARNKPPKSLF